MRFQPAAVTFAVSLAAISASFVAPAFAGPATQSEANRIEAALQGYFGKLPGVVSVTPEGDTYNLRIDPAPVLAKLPPEISVSMTTLNYTLTDQGGGLWGTKLADAPISIKIKTTGPQAMDEVIAVGSIDSTGTFDETLGAFRQSNSVFKDVTVHQTQMDGDQTISVVDQKIDSVQYQTTGSAGAHGLDVQINQTASGLSMKMAITPPAKGDKPGTPVDIAATAETATQNMQGSGLRLTGILAFYRWVLDHPTGEQMKTAKSEMAPLIGAMLPVFDNLQGTGAVNAVKVMTPIGPVGLDKIGFKISMNGVAPEGLFLEGISVEGVHLPPGIVPPFAEPLVPQKVAFDFKLNSFDLAAPAKILLDEMAAETPMPQSEMEAKLLAAALPTGAVTVSTEDTQVSGADYALTLSGNLKAGPDTKVPPMDFLLTAKGYDKVLAALDEFPPQMKQQALPMLMLARGFAKTEANGDLTWKFETSPEGHLMVNGQDMGPMGGRPKP